MKRVYLIILLALLITHGAGLFNGITWDDRYLLPKAGEASLADVFLDRNAGSSGTAGSYYRPLRTLLFKTVMSIPGPEIMYLHFVSIMLHFAAASLLFIICFRISGSKWGSLLLSLLFSVHPVTTESVAGISNIKEILSTVFVLSAVYYLWLTAKGETNNRRASLLICTFTLLGLLSKETALAIPAMAVAMPMIYRHNWRNTLKYASAPAMAVSVIYLLLILIVVPGPEKGEYMFDSAAITLYTTCAAFIKYVKLFFFPLDLSIRHDVPAIMTFFDWRVITVSVSMLLLGALAVYLILKKDSRAVPLVFFLVTLIPISNIVPIRGHIMSERYFYMPLSGIMMTAAGFFLNRKFSLKYLYIFLIPLILVFSVKTGLRTLEWKNDRTLFESAVKTAPDSLIVRWSLFEIYRKNNEPVRAQAEYREMVRINKEMTSGYIEYARVLQAGGMTKRAERLWDRAEYTASGNPELLEYVRSERMKSQQEFQ